jgi:hypothetical protein
MKQMKSRCPFAKLVGKTYIRNWRLVFHHYADIEPGDDCITPALVWEISDDDEKKLDKYEGYPEHYIKIDIAVEVNGKYVQVMAYIMTDWKKNDEQKSQHPPSEQYLECILQGYRDAGFSDEEFSERMRQNGLTFSASKN